MRKTNFFFLFSPKNGNYWSWLNQKNSQACLKSSKEATNVWVTWTENTPAKKKSIKWYKLCAKVWFNQEAQSIISNKMKKPRLQWSYVKEKIQPFELNVMYSKETALIVPMLSIGIVKKVWNCVRFHYRPILFSTQVSWAGIYNRPVTREGGMVCTCLDISSVNFFCFKTFILQLEMVEHLKVRQECYRIENHYFKFIQI